MERKEIIKIDSIVNGNVKGFEKLVSKRRVCGYARVSTDKDDQFSSYEAQVNYYTDYIKSNNEWEFVKVYTDEGITGTCVRLRPGFNEMINDALNNKIDLIVTKSISRFARNTVDSLITIRKLKEVGCECFFEKENIYTFDSKGELLITIMSSIAQEESRSISENVTWGIRKRLAQGKYTIKTKEFLGYAKDLNNNIIINSYEASIVKRIYLMYLEGLSYFDIAKVLTNDGVFTPMGKSKWYSSVIKSILTNEKYIGDALLQKTYSIDFLSKKRKKNDGILPKYYVKNGHEAIIDRNTYNLVKKRIDKNKSSRFNEKDNYFSKRIKCGGCGNWFCKCIWKKNNKDDVIMYRCNRRYKNNCSSPFISIKAIEELYNKAIDYLDNNILLLIKSIKKLIIDNKIYNYYLEELKEIEKNSNNSKRLIEIKRIIAEQELIKKIYCNYENDNDFNNLKKELLRNNIYYLVIDYFIYNSNDCVYFVLIKSNEKIKL